MKLLAVATACLAILLVIVAVQCRRYQSRLDQSEAQVVKYRRFCVATRAAIRQDRLDFESGDLKRQEAALARFYDSSIMHHSVLSVLMCLESESAPEFPSGCWLGKDWDCLGRSAERIEDALREWSGAD